MTRQLQITLLAIFAAAGVGLSVAQVREEPPSPAQPGEGDGGVRFEVPRVEPPRMAQPAPLRVETFDVREVAEGSDWGSPGDLLVTFQGQGFQLTAKAPQVLLSEEFALEATEISRDGTELYVLIPRDLVPKIERMRFERIVIANPGGLQGIEYARTEVAATPEQLLRPKPEAPKVRLLYRDGAFTREPGRQ